MSYQHELSTLH